MTAAAAVGAGGGAAAVTSTAAEQKGELNGIQVVLVVDTSKHMKKQDCEITGTKLSRYEYACTRIRQLAKPLFEMDDDG